MLKNNFSPESYTFKIGGEAGYGIMTAGLVFSKTCTRSGFHIFDYAEYPSLIRGGHNVMETHFGAADVHSQERGVDLLVALNQETIDRHQEELKERGGIVFDPEEVRVEKSVKLFPVPLGKIVGRIGGPKVMINNVALGAAAALFGLDLKILLAVIKDIFKDKGQKIVEVNQQAARAGFDYIGDQDFSTHVQNFVNEEKLVLTGNEAIALGALAGGCNFYAAYPMTPASSILHFLAGKALETGMVVRHAEDEIGVINEAIGASFAGARAMIGTSGGGFALMNEAVSLSGITETPLTIVVVQRPGPATGMPTWTEQGDLQFIIRSGHGEFPKIVLAPGDVEEAFFLTFDALNLAAIYQTPVFVVSDKYLSESHRSAAMSNLKTKMSKLRIAQGKPLSHQANSYEHLEDGHTTEDAGERVRQVDKRARKASTYVDVHFRPPKFYGSPEAKVTFVGWGSVKGPVLEALKQSTTSNQQFNFLHFTHIWPMDGEVVRSELEKCNRLVLIENNSTGQLGQLLRQETGIKIKEKLLKYDGRPFYPEEIMDYVEGC
jgi:2-oxoglutarate ferredoxin oxidoreductase subunit alpha